MPTNIPNNITGDETRATSVLGPVSFDLSGLKIEGAGNPTVPPALLAPGDSPLIVASNESLTFSLTIAFNNSPLTKLLLCLGTKMAVCFSLEGMGRKTQELDFEVVAVTEKNEFSYTLTFTGTPDQIGITPGLYVIAAVAAIGPSEHPCANDVYGYGYIAGTLLQVYPA
ncbi:MAG: hypothetical protein AAFU71_19420 [Cyanobacteria bacterium J06632_22]